VVTFLLWMAARLVLREIGARALAAQPDTIRLVPATPGVWRDPDAQERIAAALLERGFRDAGTYSIPELPGVAARLLAHEPDMLHAAIVEHPKAGTWLDLVCRYEDGVDATFSTLPASGLDPRPGFLRVNAPGTSPEALLVRIRAERPRRPMRPARVQNAAAEYAGAWAEEIAWRKRRGISVREVAQVAERAHDEDARAA
jgi:hypothetical protein